MEEGPMARLSARLLAAFAFLNSGAVDFLHFFFGQRAIAGMLDTIAEIIEICAEGIERAN